MVLFLTGIVLCEYFDLCIHGDKNQDLYRAELRKSDTVISCVGGFGRTDAYMELVNGEANIKLAEVIENASLHLKPRRRGVEFLPDPLFETINVCAAFIPCMYHACSFPQCLVRMSRENHVRFYAC